MTPVCPEEMPVMPPDDFTCQQAVALLVEYVASAMPPETLRAFQAHLRACDECLAFLHTYRATIQATRTLRYEALPGLLQDRVLGFLRRRVTRGGHRPWTVRRRGEKQWVCILCRPGASHQQIS
jgi:anti-sigma factor RsiW